METTLIYDIRFNDKELHDQLVEYMNCDAESAYMAADYCDYLRDIGPDGEDSFEQEEPKLSFDEKEFMKRLNDKVGIKSEPEEDSYVSCVGVDDVVGAWFSYCYDNATARVKYKLNEGDEIECLIYGLRGRDDVDNILDYDKARSQCDVYTIESRLKNLFEIIRDTVGDDMRNKSKMSEEEFERGKRRVIRSIRRAVEYSTIDEEEYSYPGILSALYEVQRLYEIKYFDDSIYKQLMSEILKKLKGQHYLWKLCGLIS